MSKEYAEHARDEAYGKTAQKREYASPRLIRYGAVRDMTQTGTYGHNENSINTCNSSHVPSGFSCPPSERRVKENIVRVGSHPAGFGLYLFDYLPEHRELWGQGRQFGVMIDEVEAVMPSAVSSHADGYKRVDYGMLGISRNLH